MRRVETDLIRPNPSRPLNPCSIQHLMRGFHEQECTRCFCRCHSCSYVGGDSSPGSAIGGADPRLRSGERLAVSSGVRALDLASGKEVSKFLPGFVLIGIGLTLLALVRMRHRGIAFLFIGLVQFLSTLLSGVSKNLFGRPRPFELLEKGGWDHAWFEGGSSFPSGHTGFYFGLFLPLAYLFPRWRWPLLATPFFVAIARYAHHFNRRLSESFSVVILFRDESGVRKWKPIL